MPLGELLHIAHAAKSRPDEHWGYERDDAGEHGPGFVTPAVDPFGNVLGIMYNQHCLDVLARD